MNGEDVTVKQASRRIGVNVSRVRQLIREGRIKARLIGGKVYLIDPESLDRYIEWKNQYREERE